MTQHTQPNPQRFGGTTLNPTTDISGAAEIVGHQDDFSVYDVECVGRMANDQYPLSEDYPGPESDEHRLSVAFEVLGMLARFTLKLSERVLDLEATNLALARLSESVYSGDLKVLYPEGVPRRREDQGD